MLPWYPMHDTPDRLCLIFVIKVHLVLCRKKNARNYSLLPLYRIRKMIFSNGFLWLSKVTHCSVESNVYRQISLFFPIVVAIVILTTLFVSCCVSVVFCFVFCFIFFFIFFFFLLIFVADRKLCSFLYFFPRLSCLENRDAWGLTDWLTSGS